MEKINDVLKPLIGILLLFSFMMAFSSCEQSTQEEIESDKDIVMVTDTVVVEKDEDTLRWSKKVAEESRKIERRLDSLEVKAKRKGEKAEGEISRLIVDLNEERKEIINDSTDEKIEERWEKFKARTEAAIDSLDKRI